MPLPFTVSCFSKIQIGSGTGSLDNPRQNLEGRKCVCACACACVHACVSACVCACLRCSHIKCLICRVHICFLLQCSFWFAPNMFWMQQLVTYNWLLITKYSIWAVVGVLITRGKIVHNCRTVVHNDYMHLWTVLQMSFVLDSGYWKFLRPFCHKGQLFV